MLFAFWLQRFYKCKWRIWKYFQNVLKVTFFDKWCPIKSDWMFYHGFLVVIFWRFKQVAVKYAWFLMYYKCRKSTPVKPSKSRIRADILHKSPFWRVFVWNGWWLKLGGLYMVWMFWLIALLVCKFCALLKRCNTKYQKLKMKFLWTLSS